MLVDMDEFDANIGRIKALVQGKHRRVRLATKSLRCPDLIKRALQLGTPVFKGLMCFSVPEAAYLHSQGLDDFLVAYPTLERSHLELVREMLKKGATLALTVDHPEHLAILAQEWKALGSPQPLPICLDADVSLRMFRGLIHLGVRRSSILDLDAFYSRLRDVARRPELELVGILTYEAQVAGLPDRNPFSPFLNWAKEAIRKISAQDMAQKRNFMSQALKDLKLSIRFFNGGGTGSLDLTLKEPWIDEVTVGSGLFHSHLFDYYSDKHTQAALYFTLPVTRLPASRTVTCQSGGFMASGEVSRDKAPITVSPEGLRPISSEGFGEVQTPFKVPANTVLALGDRVVLRPAKAGESTERFPCIHMFRGDKVEGRAPTYRGLGQNFY